MRPRNAREAKALEEAAKTYSATYGYMLWGSEARDASMDEYWDEEPEDYRDRCRTHAAWIIAEWERHRG